MGKKIRFPSRDRPGRGSNFHIPAEALEAIATAERVGWGRTFNEAVATFAATPAGQYFFRRQPISTYLFPGKSNVPREELAPYLRRLHGDVITHLATRVAEPGGKEDFWAYFQCPIVLLFTGVEGLRPRRKTKDPRKVLDETERGIAGLARAGLIHVGDEGIISPSTHDIPEPNSPAGLTRMHADFAQLRDEGTVRNAWADDCVGMVKRAAKLMNEIPPQQWASDLAPVLQPLLVVMLSVLKEASDRKLLAIFIGAGLSPTRQGKARNIICEILQKLQAEGMVREKPDSCSKG